MHSRPEGCNAVAEAVESSHPVVQGASSKGAWDGGAAAASDLIRTCRQRIDGSRTLMLQVAQRSLRAGRSRVDRSEQRISRSLTLLLESDHRVRACRDAEGRPPAPATQPVQARHAPVRKSA